MGKKDSKVINGKKVKDIVKFECLVFNPHFNYGDHCGKFFLKGQVVGTGYPLVSSEIINIHEIDNIVYVETMNSMYQIEEARRIYYLDYIIKYLRDKDYSSKEFFDQCVLNFAPTIRGWRVF